MSPSFRAAAASAALFLAACNGTPSGDSNAGAPQELMGKTVPAGSSLSKSTDEWKAYHNGQPDQTTPCDAEADMGSTEVLWVGENHAVLKLLCLRGAYQSAYVFYNILNVGAQENVTALWFDVFDDEGNRTRTNMLTDALYDRAAKTLTSLSKQRGATDCGTAATYAWRDDMGGFFDLMEFRQKLECDGTATDFPVIYTRGEAEPPEGQIAE